MEEESKNPDVGSSFSLIDFSCDDDFLLMPQSSDGLLNQRSSGPSENCNDHSCNGNFEGENAEGVPGVLNSCNDLEKAHGSLVSAAEPNITRKSSKCNLRKSLAWDNAFFTSEGILDADELEVVSKTFKKSPLCPLPGIQEDLRKSTESTATLGSDASVLESLEVELFEDIRASIQKSGYDYGRTSDLTLSSSKAEQRESNMPCTAASTKVQNSHNKMKPVSKPLIAHKRQSLSKQALESKVVLVHPRVVTASSGEQNSSLKPPKVIIKVISTSTQPTKPSAVPTKKILPSECIKIKNNMTKAIGSGSNQKSAVASKKPISGSESSGPASSIPSPPSSSSSGSSRSTKTLPTTPSSTKKSGITKTLRNRVESRNINPPSKDLIVKTPLRSSKSKMGSGNSNLTAYVKSTSKVSPSISPASSIDGFSSESSSSTCATSQISDSSKASRDISCASSYGGDLSMRAAPEPPHQPHVGQEVSLPGPSVERASSKNGVLSHPAAANAPRSCINYNSIQHFKPSGLRMPSPKIGFFDADKTSMCTSNAGSRFYPGLRSGLLKKNASGINNLDGALKHRPSKLQHAKPPPQFGTVKFNSHVTGPSNQAYASSIKPIYSQKPQQPFNLSHELSSTTKPKSPLHKNVKVQDSSVTTSRESKSKTREVQDAADTGKCGKNADMNMEEYGDQNTIKRNILAESNKESTLEKSIDMTSMLPLLEKGAQVPLPVTHLYSAVKPAEDNIDSRSFKGEPVLMGQKENITESNYNSSPAP